MIEILAMGGYGAYVWSSFGLTLVVLLTCAAQGARRHRTVFNQLRARIRAMESDS